ncbi:hypothetical protein GYMLUDRAFT_45300 [Collybiopsis luxurians FD-317 M1]|uniref:BZIP domain-containing protein n=1 Tax=Collybiopsis luxurians FD-317 M1 TaxID=944289 RepID=A0A0D0CRX9_9AGAR|nr:hypothetical protein GYMLUDRAFT_45300 [Collybiopsis luxurians FD-317 M1]
MESNNMYSYFDPTGGLQDPSAAAAEAYLRSTLADPSQSSYMTEPQIEAQAQGSYIPQHEPLPPAFAHMHHHTSSSSSAGSASNSHGNSNRTRHNSPTSPLDHPVTSYHTGSASSSRGDSNMPRRSSPSSPMDHPVSSYQTSSRPRRSPNQRMLSLPDDDDDSEDEPLPPNASAKERSDWKKRRNTKAARRSRKRKAIYTERLEATVERLRLEKETWKTRALTLRQLLKSHNLPCPDFDD